MWDLEERWSGARRPAGHIGMKPTVADHIAAFLVDRGVEIVFGLCGHTNISVLAALHRAGAPRFVTSRHEQVAAHAADGYARASGEPGVVLLPVGPGLTNAVTGVATASFDSIPLLVIAGDVPTYYEGGDPSGVQSASRRRPAVRVRAIREASMARSPCRPDCENARSRVGPRACGSPRPGPRVSSDGHPG